MEKGLSLPRVQELQKIHGKNVITTKESFSVVSLFISQFTTFINAILFAAAVFSFIIHDPVDGLFILAIIFLNALFGFIQEYKAEKSLEKLKNYITPIVRVIREGKEREIPAENLVPGDIVILSEGDRVPADGLLLQSHHMEIDESILTGESLPVIKQIKDAAFNGTLIIKGKGYLRVEKIGMETKFGQIAQTLSAIETTKTPLQKQLDSLGKILSLLALSTAFLLIPLGLLQEKALVPLLLLAISIGIAAIPEGMPAVITIALAIGTNRMAKRNAIIRKMPAVETLGAIQYLLTDKTGTLTQNNMQVKKFWTPEKNLLEDVLHACVLGNTASLVQKAGSKSFDVTGDKTDGALLVWAHEQTNTKKLLANTTVVDEYVFDSATKMVTTVIHKGHKQYAYVRGAPEAILAKSTLSAKEKDHVEQRIAEYAQQGYRVIGFGMKTATKSQKLSRAMAETSLHFLGIVGIYDAPRKEAKDAMLQARKAGIKVIMVTGDNELTALAIGQEIGLIEKNEDVMRGDELAKLSDAELLRVLPNVRIFARSQPQDKLRIATLLQQQGYVVGVTGDGVNDALALKKADVGIAMGQTGTDVAREASDIVLTDDNFATFIKAIEEGRSIYQNISKAIVYLLASNLSELMLIVGAALLGMPNPLLPTQILWINLATDGLPALALASDNKSPDVLSHKPRDPKVPFLTQQRLAFIGSVGISITLVLLFIFNNLLGAWSEVQARTIIFNLLVLSHLTLAFIIRGKSILRVNKLLLLAVIITITLQTIITTVPFFQKIFDLSL